MWFMYIEGDADKLDACMLGSGGNFCELACYGELAIDFGRRFAKYNPDFVLPAYIVKFTGNSGAPDRNIKKSPFF